MVLMFLELLGMKDGMDLELTKHMGSNDMDFMTKFFQHNMPTYI